MQITHSYLLVYISLLAAGVRRVQTQKDFNILTFGVDMKNLCPYNKFALTFGKEKAEIVNFFVKQYTRMVVKYFRKMDEEAQLPEADREPDAFTFRDKKRASANHFELPAEEDLEYMGREGYNSVDIVSDSWLSFPKRFMTRSMTDEDVRMFEYFQKREMLQELDPHREHFQFYGFCVNTKHINQSILKLLKKKVGKNTLRAFKQKLLAPMTQESFFTVEEHFEKSLTQMFEEFAGGAGQFRLQDKLEMITSLLSSLKVLHLHFKHCDIGPEAIKFKSLSRGLINLSSKSSLKTVQVNHAPYLVKLGELTHLKAPLEDCFTSRYKERFEYKASTNLNKKHEYYVITKKQGFSLLKEYLKKVNDPKHKVDSDDMMKDFVYIGDDGGPQYRPDHDLTFGGLLESSDLLNLGWTLLEVECRQWTGFSVLDVFKTINKGLRKKKKFKQIFEDSLFPDDDQDSLVGRMLQFLVNADPEDGGANPIAKEIAETFETEKTESEGFNFETGNPMEAFDSQAEDFLAEDLLHSFFLADDDAKGLVSFILSLRLYITRQVIREAIKYLEEKVPLHIQSAKDERRKAVFSVFTVSNEERDASIKDAIIPDVYEIMMRTKYLPVFLTNYYDQLVNLTELKEEMRNPPEYIISNVQSNQLKLGKLADMVKEKIVALDGEKAATFELDVENIHEMFSTSSYRMLI